MEGEKDSFEEKAAAVGVLREANEDLRSLKELLVYGLKGMAAYHEHAMRLGYSNGKFMRSCRRHWRKLLSAD